MCSRGKRSEEEQREIQRDSEQVPERERENVGQEGWQRVLPQEEKQHKNEDVPFTDFTLEDHLCKFMNCPVSLFYFLNKNLLIGRNERMTSRYIQYP